MYVCVCVCAHVGVPVHCVCFCICVCFALSHSDEGKDAYFSLTSFFLQFMFSFLFPSLSLFGQGWEEGEWMGCYMYHRYVLNNGDCMENVDG